MMRELDFSKFETSLEELKEFCGVRPDESVFMDGEEAESVISDRPSATASAQAGATEAEGEEAFARVAKRMEIRKGTSINPYQFDRDGKTPSEA